MHDLALARETQAPARVKWICSPGAYVRPARETRAGTRLRNFRGRNTDEVHRATGSVASGKVVQDRGDPWRDRGRAGSPALHLDGGSQP